MSCGQARNQGGIVAGDRGGGGKAKAGCGAVADVGGLVVGQDRQPLPDRLDQLQDIDEGLGGVGHRLGNLGRHGGPTEAGIGGGAIDDLAYAELVVDVRHDASPS